MQPRERRPDQTESNLTDQEQEAVAGTQWDPVKVNKDDLTVTLQTREFPRFTVDHTIIKQSDTLSRIVFQIKKLSVNTMNELCAKEGFFYREIANIFMENPEAHFSASPSPMFRGQWDLMMEGLDSSVAPITRDRVLHILEMFCRSTQGSQAL